MTQHTTEVTLLTQADWAHCDHPNRVLSGLGQEFPLRFSEIGLDTDQRRELATRWGIMFAPGILLEGRGFGYGRRSERRLRRELTSGRST